MDDAELVNQVPVEFLAREGPNAIVTLRERAEIAAGIGDDFSFRAWTDIAEAAARLLSERF